MTIEDEIRALKKERELGKNELAVSSESFATQLKRGMGDDMMSKLAQEKNEAEKKRNKFWQKLYTLLNGKGT